MLKQDTLLYLLNKLTNARAEAIMLGNYIDAHSNVWYANKISEVLKELGISNESNN